MWWQDTHVLLGHDLKATQTDKLSSECNAMQCNASMNASGAVKGELCKVYLVRRTANHLGYGYDLLYLNYGIHPTVCANEGETTHG
jgi:hypothetical protein